MTKEELESQRLDIEFEKAIAKHDKIVDEGQKNIIKYFDRIHDKLFNFNNIIIAGSFALSKIENSVPLWTILVPIFNLIIIVYIEFRMMELGRFDVKSGEKTLIEIKDNRRSINKTNLFSLLTITTTFVTTCFFLYNLIFISK
ncbi:hypothetical protein [Flavobacterium sp. Root420]|uniref:hypothetical protein n=1 Tax=Flavobacterium sp. Root420 TaxID=1736533 RepID=UPI0006FFACB5|nr:hypothetical protein [Flavobacterium sp. Root420]KQX00658.1 hypothetical protein ASC72_07235 [Flavobacterium sp. Root420]